MKLMMSLLVSCFFLIACVGAVPSAADIDLSAYGVEGTVNADVDVKNVEVGADGSVKADVDVKSNFQGKVNGQDVNSQTTGAYAIDAPATGDARVNATVKDDTGKVIGSVARTFATNDIRTGSQLTLSNGKRAEVKIMPSTASATAIARLSLKSCSAETNCTIVLKETGSGNSTNVVYEVKAPKRFKVFGLFSSTSNVTAEVDVVSGEVVKVHKPWWSFMASSE